jgi:hypothetical protein
VNYVILNIVLRGDKKMASRVKNLLGALAIATSKTSRILKLGTPVALAAVCTSCGMTYGSFGAAFSYQSQTYSQSYPSTVMFSADMYNYMGRRNPYFLQEMGMLRRYGYANFNNGYWTVNRPPGNMYRNWGGFMMDLGFHQSYYQSNYYQNNSIYHVNRNWWDQRCPQNHRWSNGYGYWNNYRVYGGQGYNKSGRRY